MHRNPNMYNRDHQVGQLTTACEQISLATMMKTLQSFKDDDGDDDVDDNDEDDDDGNDDDFCGEENNDFCDDDDAYARSDERDQILERRLVVSQVELLSHLNSI